VRAQELDVVTADSLPASSRATLGASSADVVARRLTRLGNVGADVRRIYGDGALTLLWSRDGAPTTSAVALLDELDRLRDRGLEPDDYDVDHLRKLLDAKLRTPEAREEFDVTMSVAAMRVVRALRDGRVVRVDSATLQPLDSVLADRSAEVRALAESKAPEALLDAAEPASDQYRLLKNALGTYRTLAVSDSVARGQLSSILLTLERERMLRTDVSRPAVVVNIPEFRLRAQGDAGSADTLGMDVVVGVAARHRTPVMSDSIQYLVFAPYWEVPRSIITAELLPIARRDPYLLTTNNYQILDRRGRVLPATAASVKLVESGRARIRQLPGGTNSLGRVKFMFPNAEDVYLHDTPLRNDFVRPRRDQSHGCVRVADPVALAKLLLRDQPQWTPEAIEAAMNGKVPVTVKLTRPVPVHLSYATAVADADGRVTFFDDIYGLDAELSRRLAMSTLAR
jgi:murein L,D-transpeptidase YcbB/YkuD